MAFLDEVDRLDRNQEQGIPRIVLAGAAVLLAVVALLAYLGVLPAAGGGITVVSGGAAASSEQEGSSGALESQTEADAAGAASESQADASASSTPELCYVYVVGAVSKPGVYGVAPGARVNDVIEAAGGMAEDADITAVNLARTIVDGEQIHVPRIGEEPPAAAPSASQADAVPADASGTPTAPAAPSTSGSSGKVNINTADSAELQTLKGVGEATAEKIIASREAEGPFTAPEDLKRVSGIGEKKYAALADDIEV